MSPIDKQKHSFAFRLCSCWKMHKLFIVLRNSFAFSVSLICNLLLIVVATASVSERVLEVHNLREIVVISAGIPTSSIHCIEISTSSWLMKAARLFRFLGNHKLASTAGNAKSDYMLNSKCTRAIIE